MTKLPESVSDSISKRILLYILLLSSLVTLIITGVTLYLDYLADRRIVLNQLISVERTIAPSVAQALWIFDDESLEVTINPVVRNDGIQYIELLTSDQKKRLYASGEKGDIDRMPDHIAPVIYNRGNGDLRVLGYLRLYADFSMAKTSLRLRFFRTALAQAIKTFIIASFIIFLVHHLVSRHLVQLARQINHHQVATNPIDSAFTINRKSENDELQLLVNTLNDYRDRIHYYQLTLDQKNKALSSQLEINHQANQQEIEKNRSINLFLDQVNISVLWVDKSFRITRYNTKASSSLETSTASIGKSINSLIKLSVDEQSIMGANILDHLLLAPQQALFNGFCQIDSGLSFPAYVTTIPLYRDNKVNEFAVLIENIKDTRLIEEIHYNATHDYLTGLYNRYQMDRLFSKLRQTVGAFDEYTVGFIDLDRFKVINDMFGHEMGDKVLVKTAEILQSVLGKDQLISRQGGDEFIFLLKAGREQSIALSQQVADELAAVNFNGDENIVHVTASIGLTRMEFLNKRLKQSFARADKASYLSKKKGGNTVSYVSILQDDDNQQKQYQEYKQLQTIKEQIEQGDVVLYAQDIVPLQPDTGLPVLPVRREILSRIQDDNHLIYPDEFIPLLERTRIMPLFELHILSRLAELLKQQTLPEFLNVNLSPASLHSEQTFLAISQLLDAAMLSDSQICFELTEDQMIKNDPKMREILQLIKSKNGLVAIDDFGKGHASYSYLDTLDIDMIKIDGSLITRIKEESKIRAIVASIQTVAESIGALTVAEHVVSAQQKAIVRDMGINYSQGFIDGRPSLYDGRPT